MVWVFSNKEALAYFEKNIRPKVGYKNIFSFLVSPNEIKFLQNL